MLYLAIFDAKEDISLEEINREREAWIKRERDKVFKEMCKHIERYEVAGMIPMKIVFLIETDDPLALNMLSRHFGDLWYSVSYPVIRRGISEAFEEDKTIIAG